MHSHDAKHPREKSSLLLFVPITIFAVYIVYLVVSVSYRKGMTQGILENTYYVPEQPKEDEAEVFDHRKLMKPTEDLITLGSKVYLANCASCHGDEGHGDGSAGSKLAVKPRNYAAPEGDWKNGSSVITMYHTLEKGVATMPNFPALNPKQKYAVIHYVHASFMKDRGWKEDTQAAIDGLPSPGAGASVKIDPYAETRIPVRFAMRKLAEELPDVAPAAAAPVKTGLGRSLYAAHCSECHGDRGEGVRPEKVATVSQLKKLAGSGSLLRADGKWADDYEEFRSVVTKGMPGGIKPAFATLTEEELKALYDHTRSLR